MLPRTICAYQGGKARYAKQIVPYIRIEEGERFAELCCGTGAVTMELLNQRSSPLLPSLPPENITLVDAGEWGRFWKRVADDTFDLEKFRIFLGDVPDNPDHVQFHLQELASATPSEDDLPYIYLILQAGAFGGKQIGISWDGDKYQWVKTGFKNYWQPKEGTSRQFPVLPMQPTKHRLYHRVETIVEELGGRINAYHGVVQDFAVDPHGKHIRIDAQVIYIDPPYKGTAPYHNSLDVRDLNFGKGVRVYASEGERLSSEAYLLDEKVTKGNIKGNINGSKNQRQEWLSVLNYHDTLYMHTEYDKRN